MANPFAKPSLAGYNPSPAPDTGLAGGTANIVRWSKHTDELTDPLRNFAQAIADNIEDAFENMFGTGNINMVFIQASAPVGWTQRTDFSDRTIRLVPGTGGAVGGGPTWEITGLTSPAHSHAIDIDGTTEATTSLTEGADGTGRPTATHTHDFNVSGNTAGSGVLNVSSDGNWRPPYVNAIVATRSFG